MQQGSKKDENLECLNCGQRFVFTVGEQDFYASKGMKWPEYCMICRAIKGAENRDPGAGVRKMAVSD